MAKSQTGGVFHIQNDIALGASNGTEFFDNAGLVRKSADVGTISISAACINSGTVAVLQGRSL